MPNPPRPSTPSTSNRPSASRDPTGSSAAAAMVDPHQAHTSQDPPTSAPQVGHRSLESVSSAVRPGGRELGVITAGPAYGQASASRRPPGPGNQGSRPGVGPASVTRSTPEEQPDDRR